jgi:hypothetical protein
MRGKWSPFRLPPRWRWVMWSFLGLSGSGIVVGVWLLEDPLAVAGEVCLPLAALTSIHAIAIGFYHCVFKAHSPCRKEADHHLSKRS